MSELTEVLGARIRLPLPRKLLATIKAEDAIKDDKNDNTMKRKVENVPFLGLGAVMTSKQRACKPLRRSKLPGRATLGCFNESSSMALRTAGGIS